MLALTDYNRYTAVVDNGIARSDLLTSSEEQFILSLHTKFSKYRRSTFISEKQADWLDSIETKLREEMGTTYEE